MSVAAFFKEPLQGKTSLSRVIWLYGVLGSILYGAIELFLNPENQWVMRLYAIGGLLYTVYAIVATYRCAANSKSKSPRLARVVRISAVICLLLLPVLFYLDFTGTLSLAGLLSGQLPE
jgi:hypothetical protein